MIMSAAPPAYADTGHGTPHNWVADKTEKVKVSETKEYKDVKYLDTTPMIDENDPKWTDPVRYGYGSVIERYPDGKIPGDSSYANNVHHVDGTVLTTIEDGWSPKKSLWINDVTTSQAYAYDAWQDATTYFNNGHQDDEWKEFYRNQGEKAHGFNRGMNRPEKNIKI